mmetsp:Transcript_89370/g.239484  ORF Transcript_89370/g.239484 Transcript_89370/m.239484 type:complete len:121 (-) Transcript_89370:89-451(-)
MYNKGREEMTPKERMTFDVLVALNQEMHRRLIRVKEVFQALDTDCSGTIDPNELLSGLATYNCNVYEGRELTLLDMVHLMETVDDNFDGTLSLKELNDIMTRVHMAVANNKRSTKRSTFL